LVSLPDHWVEKLLLGLACVLLAFVLWFFVAMYQDSKLPTFNLRKDEWVCQKEELRTLLLPQFVGKAVIYIPHSRQECVEYRRVKP
jgi:hypothetical protein